MRRIILLFTFVIVLSGCKNTVEYEHQTNYQFSEEMTDIEISNFKDSVSIVLRNLEDKEIIDDVTIYFNITNNETSYVDYKSDYNIIYTNIDSNNSIDLVLLVILSLYPEDANYGLLYGLADYISKDLGYANTHVSTQTEIEIFELILDEKWYLKDMVFPCFSSRFTSEEDIILSKSLSVSFVEYIIDDIGMNYLVDFIARSNDLNVYYEEYNSLLNIWNNELSSERPFIIVNARTAFVNYIEDEELIWSTSRALWITKIGEEDHDNLYGVIFEKDFYSEIKLLMTTINNFEDEFDRLDSKIKYPENEYPILKIEIYMNSFSWYYLNGLVTIESLLHLGHEYVHYLDDMNDLYIGDWVGEARATYYGIKGKYYQQYMEFLIAEEHSDELVIAKTIFEEAKDVEFDYQKDVFLLLDIYVSNLDTIPNIMNITPYHHFEWISFINYLVTTYGEEEFTSLCFDNITFLDGTDTTWEDLISDWELYINNNDYLD